MFGALSCWKTVSCSFLWESVFFFNLLYDKYSKTLFLTKKFILIFVVRHPPPFPLNGRHILLWMVFRNLFNINWRTSAKFSYSKVSFERKFLENKPRSYKIFTKCDALHEKRPQVGKTNFIGKWKNRIQVKMNVSSFFLQKLREILFKNISPKYKSWWTEIIFLFLSVSKI